MSETLYLPISYQGKELELEVRMERWGYTYRIAVLIGDETVLFEPDEEGSYRAMTADGMPGKTAPGLLRAIVAQLAGLLP
ncbi:hypothetical protein GCM10023149_21840 [Mucilaginibacter gynuensis]|uniref:Uncharacterized protein n=1 Tax=Mucilaginibacter gynuensis TaxID=1302236 RepID=A0ABP8GCN5_9SPHI